MTTYAQDSDGKNLFDSLAHISRSAAAPSKLQYGVMFDFDLMWIFRFHVRTIITGKYIPASQRPDGTWRKARRVKDGYVPQEEVPLYESKGKQSMKKPAIPVGMCPIVAQEAKAKRERQQNRQQQSSSTNSVAGVLVLPNSTDPAARKKTQNANKSQTESSKNSNKAAAASTTIATTKSKAKSKKSGSNVLSTALDVNHTLNNAINNLCITQDDDIAKKLKKLRKKIREIEAIEAKLAAGELKCPEQDQLDKIGRKDQILDELKSLEQLEQQQQWKFSSAYWRQRRWERGRAIKKRRKW